MNENLQSFLAALNRVIDRAEEGWETVDVFKSGDIVVTGRAFHVACDALRALANNSKTWEGAL
jgi:hypothetical protein